MAEEAPPIVHGQRGDEDGDSGIGDIDSSSESDDTSVLSNAKDYVEENDRLYHADWIDGQYLLPKDEREQQRLNSQHGLLFDANRLHKAPLQRPLNVLDVGTGTGRWAIAFAEAYPSAAVTAVDISPDVMPTWTHPNCEFFVEDAENGLGMGNEEFDYVHVRLLHGFRHPTRFIKHAWEALLPGGYVEITEFEFPLQFHDPEKAKNSALRTWSTNVMKGSLGLGIDLTIASKILEMLQDRGFEDIEESISAWPIGAWPKQKGRKALGTLLQEYWLETLTAFAWRPLREMDWHKEETQCLLAKMRTEVCSQQIRASMHVRTFWARKP
ncbi:S-adenosyl-L-methionine-dependent methyltransferase [Bisporella sp. PMI_857]|nr:S-adenosyl-L-methionine-dependent methyltransferase [Bisporella sp. PMI_857]